MSYTKSKFVKELSPKDFDGVNLKKKICGAVVFYSPHCPHCVMMHDTWEAVAEKAIFAEVCALNCEEYSDFVNSLPRGFVDGYPTVYYYSGGKPTKQHDGARTEGEFIKRLMICKTT